jgi:uncharacterized membrane protein YsdA (DUF1294 family)
MALFLIILNLITLIIFGYDKFLATNHKKRISENMLLSVTFFGGTIGTLLGMLIFRHKISKRSFLLKFAFVVLIQVVLICFFEKYIK